MPYKRFLALGALMSTLAFPSQAHIVDDLYQLYWSPHIGVDFKYWGIDPSESYKELYPKIDNAINIYVGTRINGFFGIDVGYEQSMNKDKTKVFTGNGLEEPFVNIEMPGNSSAVQVRLRDIHVDFNFYWNVVRNVEIMFMAGIVFLSPDTHIQHLQAVAGPLPTTLGTWIEYRNESRNKPMGRIGIGAQYDLTQCLGIKAMFTFDPVKRINDVGYDENQQLFDIHPYTHSTAFNIGLVYSVKRPREIVYISQ
jgi:hypothetical protein